jgi:hypothetical protein
LKVPDDVSARAHTISKSRQRKFDHSEECKTHEILQRDWQRDAYTLPVFRCPMPLHKANLTATTRPGG